jgi:hypothetical protein
VAAALAVPAAPAGAARASEIVSVVDLGRGASETWIFTPTEPPRCVVVFLHGGGDLDPARYTSWLDYLVLGKTCAVVFPRYQQSRTTVAPAAALRALRAGIKTGLAYVRRSQYGLEGNRPDPAVPVIVAGIDYGASLAFYYAANARQWRLPVPAAVDSIFPAQGRLPQTPLPLLPSGVRVLVQVADEDGATGKAAADDLRAYLASHPAARKRYRVVRSTPALRATHGAPLLTTASAESTFWVPLDGLIDAAIPG